MRRRRPPNLTSAAAAAALSLLVAACGSSSSGSTTVSGASSSGDQSRQVQQQQAVAFAGCMRSHGVSSFPDPDTVSFKYDLAPSTPHTPAFRSAVAACGHLMPNIGTQGPDRHSPAEIAAYVAFAGCMRSHGFPSFPDPSNGGQLTHEMLASAGIDLHQPAVVGAADTCVGVTHGFITKVDVARFIAGQ
jgi:hypothetical protein